MGDAATIEVEVVWSGSPGAVQRLKVSVSAQACVYDALLQARVQLPLGSLPASIKAVGIYSQICDQDTRLRAGDRIEIYRELLIDPKDARRKRVRDTAMRSG